MSTIARTKQYLAICLLVIGLALGYVALRNASAAILHASRGADPASIFNEVPPAPGDLLASMVWLPDPPRDGRVLEPGTREVITDAYTRAWAALDRAGRGDEAAPIDTYFSGAALNQAEAQLADSARLPMETVHLEHQLVLRYYSDDGSIVAIDVPKMSIIRRVGDDLARSVQPSTEHAHVVMVLLDGNWRVDQIETEPAADVSPVSFTKRAVPAHLDGANTVTVNGQDPTWTHFDPAVAVADLDLANDLGLDAVRVFVSGPEFGTVNVDAIRQFLDLAAARDIRVIVTLFDGSADHRPARWNHDATYVASIVRPLAGHRALALWDLKNEPDLDDQRSGGGAFVDAWLEHVNELVRANDTQTPLTIGWSNPIDAVREADHVDAVSFHYFGDASGLSDAVATLRDHVGTTPLLLSEFGRSAWFGRVRGDAPVTQANDIADLYVEADQLGLAARFVWVLRDPIAQPGSTMNTWAAPSERAYGVVRHDGTERAAAAVVRDRGTGDAFGVPLIERVRTMPVRTLALCAMGALGALVLVARALRRRKFRGDPLMSSPK